jgi:serine/threonine protein phosphatase PrpC
MADFDDTLKAQQAELDDAHPELHLIQSSTSINFRLAIAHEEMNSRRRNTMEDVHRVLPILHESLPNYSYLAVYDGHGGRQIVDYLEQTLEGVVAEEFLLDDDAEALERITRAFLRTDMQSKMLNITTSGATAVAAVLVNKGDGKRSLIVANVGDSRAILVSRRKPESSSPAAEEVEPKYGLYAHRLSYDHRAEDKAEQQRISESGGFVIRNRVLGILAVSRSFGDHGMKDYVIAEPHVSIVEITNSEEFPLLILACDGVWDVLSDQEAADLILERYVTEGPYIEASKLLVDTAIDKGSTDNITAIVTFL